MRAVLVAILLQVCTAPGSVPTNKTIWSIGFFVLNPILSDLAILYNLGTWNQRLIRGPDSIPTRGNIFKR